MSNKSLPYHTPQIRYDTRVIRKNLKFNSRIVYDLDSSVVERSYVIREAQGSIPVYTFLL